MAFRIVWTDHAWNDLDQIADYIVTGSKAYASGFVRQIMTRADSLELFPHAGAIVPEFDRADVRETFVKKYRLIYQVADEEIRILAVVHGARELPAAIVDRAL
jgi:plasmid stabilization system protein ParE